MNDIELNSCITRDQWGDGSGNGEGGGRGVGRVIGGDPGNYWGMADQGVIA